MNPGDTPGKEAAGDGGERGTSASLRLKQQTGHEIVYQMGTLRRGGNVGKDETLH